MSIPFKKKNPQKNTVSVVLKTLKEYTDDKIEMTTYGLVLVCQSSNWQSISCTKLETNLVSPESRRKLRLPEQVFIMSSDLTDESLQSHTCTITD